MRVAAGAGVLTVIGAATRIAGAALVPDTSWFDAMSSATGSSGCCVAAVMLRCSSVATVFLTTASTN